MAATKTVKKAPVRKAKVFSDAEMEAMQAAKSERKKGGDGEADLRAALGKLSGNDRQIGDKLDAIVRANAPGLAGKTWYGLPAWAGADGKAVVFLTPATKFKDRYSTVGFNSAAKLDDGNMWATSFAVLKLGEAEEKKLAALVKKAAG